VDITKQEKDVKEFFDYDAVKYSDQRYPDSASNCDQYSYLTRKKYVLDILDNFGVNSGVVLDIGCGPGIYTLDLLKRGCDTWGMDISEKMIERAKASISEWQGKSRAEFKTGVITDLPYQDESVDFIICIGVISYVDDIELALREVKRVLKPGGCAIIQMSNKYSPYEIGTKIKNYLQPLIRLIKKSDQDDVLLEKFHMHAYSPLKLLKQSEVSGFTRKALYFYDFKFPILRRLLPGFSLFIGKKFQTLFAESKFVGKLAACAITVIQR